MPNWRKVIVSGSDALLNSVTTPANVVNNLTASYALNTSTTAVNTGTVVEITPAQSTWTIDHSVNERYPIVTCWEADSNEIIQPDTVRSLGLNTIQVTFTRPVAGFANISRAGHVISGSFAQTASWAINATTTAINSGTVVEITPAQSTWTLYHNTHERYPIVTCWESGSNEVIQPDTIRSLNSDIVEVTFTRPVAGYANVSRAGHVLSGSWQGLTGTAEVTASGLYGGFTGSLQGTATYATTASYWSGSIVNSTSASYSENSDATQTIAVNLFSAPIDSYLLMSNVAGYSGVGIGGADELRYNSREQKLSATFISATAITASLLGTASYADQSSVATSASYAVRADQAITASFWSGSIQNATSASIADTASYSNASLTASYALTAATATLLSSTASQAVTASFSHLARTASFWSGSITHAQSASAAITAQTASAVNTLTQNVVVTGSLTVGSTALGSVENTITLGPPPAGGAGEGGQLGLQAAGGAYTSASFIDNWQDQFRILRGTNASSNAGLMYMNLQNGNTNFVGAVTASGGYSGLPNDYLYATRSGSAQTVGSAWANTDVIFNNVAAAKGITYNASTGVASLIGGRVYRITSRIAWGAAATYNLQFSCYTSANVQIGPTVEIIQSTNGTNNIGDGTLEFIYAPTANTDIKIRTTANNTALSGENIRADLNTQLIIQQIA